MVLHTTAQRTVDPPQTLISGLVDTSVAVAALNRDGRLDLLVVNGNANTVDPILNLGNAPAVSGTLLASPEPSAVGQPFTLTATLVPSGAPATTALGGTVSFLIDGNSMGTAALNGNIATVQVAGTLARGTHLLAASWPGDTTYPPVTLSGRHVVTALASTVTLNSSNNPSFAGQPVTFQAAVAGAAASSGSLPTGTVSFLGSTLLATVPLSVGGQAVYLTGSLTVGTHTLTASYSGDANFAPGSVSLVQVVQALPDSAALTVTPSPALVFQPVTLSFTLAGLVSGTVPNGSVTFLDGSAPLGSVALSAAGDARLPVTFSIAGTHLLSASFMGDSSYAPAAATASLVAGTLPTHLSLVSSLNPSLAGQPVTFNATLTAVYPATFSGQVSFFDGTTLLSTAAVAPGGTAGFSTSALRPGPHSITASFGGTPRALDPSTSATVRQVVNQAGSNTLLTASPNPAYTNQTVTLRAAVTASAGLPLTGTVTFFDGAAVLGSAPIANGTASLSTAQLSTGSHTLTASYSGDTNTLSSVSPSVVEVILLSDFVLSSTPSSLVVQTGHHLTFTVTATSQGNFADQLQLLAGPLPAHVTLLPRPATATLAQGGSTAFSVYLDSDDVIGYLSQGARPPEPTSRPGLSYAQLSCAGLGAFLLCLGLSGPRRQRPVWELHVVQAAEQY